MTEFSSAVLVSSNKCFQGTQFVYKHESSATSCEMTFGVYVPDHGADEKLPALLYLSGLTCTHANVMEKAGTQRLASQYRMIFIHPDTSPRGEDVADSDLWHLGQGAGFYLNATHEPWNKHFHMQTYVEKELLPVVASVVPALDEKRIGITGHSMGGFGAITIGLGHPEKFLSISAFAPACHLTESDWGKLAFRTYLGEDEESWKQYDAALVAAKYSGPNREILVDQGAADAFLGDLMPESLKSTSSVAFNVRMQPGYDHSYFFVSTFISDHFAHHAKALGIAT